MKERVVILRRLWKRRSGLGFLDEYLPFALVVICVASARFIASELFVFLIYIGALAIYVWRRYDARLFVGTAILLLFACAVILVAGYEDFANEVAVWAYYFLVIGVGGLFIDYLREGEAEKENDEEKI